MSRIEATERSRTGTVIWLMDHSRVGGVIQLFVMDALNKYYPTKAAVEHCHGETNIDVVRRLMVSDALRGRDSVLDAIKTLSDDVLARGRQRLRAEWTMSAFMNPDAWFTAAEDAREAILSAMCMPR